MFCFSLSLNRNPSYVNVCKVVQAGHGDVFVIGDTTYPVIGRNLPNISHQDYILRPIRIRPIMISIIDVIVNVCITGAHLRKINQVCGKSSLVFPLRKRLNLIVEVIIGDDQNRTIHHWKPLLDLIKIEHKPLVGFIKRSGQNIGRIKLRIFSFSFKLDFHNYLLVNGDFTGLRIELNRIKDDGSKP